MDILRSKKMVYFLATLVVLMIGNLTGLDPEIFSEIIYLGMVAIGGQSLADGWSGGRTSSTKKEK